MSSSRRALLFDLYGVIMRTQSPKALDRIESAAGLRGSSFWDAYWAERHAYDAGLIDGPGYWQRVSERLGQPVADVEAAIWADIEGWLNPDPGMVSYVEELAASGVQMGLLSNIPAELADEMLSRQAWLGLFEPLVLSCRTGLAKPQPEIFDIALEGLGAEPGDVLFIDDVEANVAAARTRGIDGHVFTDQKTLVPVLEQHLSGDRQSNRGIGSRRG